MFHFDVELTDLANSGDIERNRLMPSSEGLRNGMSA